MLLILFFVIKVKKELFSLRSYYNPIKLILKDYLGTSSKSIENKLKQNYKTQGQKQSFFDYKFT